MGFSLGSFDSTSNREDLLDIIEDISPTATPFSGFTTYTGSTLSNTVQVYDSDFGAKKIKPKKKRKGEDLTSLLESLLPNG